MFKTTHIFSRSLTPCWNAERCRMWQPLIRNKCYTSNQIALPYFAGITTHGTTGVTVSSATYQGLWLSIGFGLLSYPVMVFSASSFVVYLLP